MVVYRYTLKDKNLPEGRNTVYSLITNEKKNIVFVQETFESTTTMLEHDKKENDGN